MMNRVCAAPIVVRRQCQNTEEPAHQVVRQTIAKEGTMSAIMLDHEQSHEKTGSGHPRQKRQLPITEMNRCPSQRPKRDEWHERDRNLEDAATVTGLTISRENWYRSPRNVGCWPSSACAFFYHQLHHIVSLSATSTCKIRLRDD